MVTHNRKIAAFAALLACAAPAYAVGLGPLSKEGITDGHGKAFYLNLMNPYRDARTFRAYAVSFDNETPAADVQIYPDRVQVAGQRSRKLIVLMKNLQPGETRVVRICAELEKQEGAIHARVCSKLSARRIRARA